MSSSQFVTQRVGRILLIGLVACLGPPASAAAHDLPDLVADPPAQPMLEVDAGETGEERLLLRFDGHVHNEGAGPLEIRRRPGLVEQILRGASTLETIGDTRVLAADAMKFENTDGHNHWHLQRIAEYALYDGTGTAPVAPVMKVGFCLIDSLQVSGSVAWTYRSTCARNQPNATNVTMGVSSGWRDLYDRDLPFQWVDVSETQPGTYRLRSEIDPDDLIEEAIEANVPAETSYTVPGYAAMPGDARATPSPSSVFLTTSQRGAPVGPARFKIVEGPQHGTIDKPIGEWFTDLGLTYRTADESAPQRDRVVLMVDDAGSDYPRHPGRATILFGHDPLPRVALYGVPEKLRAGMAVDLDVLAREADTEKAVEWSATAGAIDQATGIYTAPSTVPPGGKVTVTATIAGGSASDAMDIAITSPAPAPEPAPRPAVDDAAEDVPPRTTTTPATTTTTQPQPPPLPVVTPRRRTPIGSVRVRRVGPQLVITVVPRASGRVRATLLRSARRLGTCVVRVRARRSALCRLRYRRGATTIALTLVRRDGRIERRRVKVPAARS